MHGPANLPITTLQEFEWQCIALSFYIAVVIVPVAKYLAGWFQHSIFGGAFYVVDDEVLDGAFLGG
jgi:hypothetical protein